MSHYVVAVFTHTEFMHEIDELLAPFNETPSDPGYLEFVPLDRSAEEIQSNYERCKDTYKSFEDFMDSYYGAHFDPSLQAWGNMCNPNAKWDWYQVGGRWAGMLKLKDKKSCCNRAQVKDVDFSLDEDEYAEAMRFWEVYVEGQPVREGENIDTSFILLKPEGYVDKYGTKEDYARINASFSTYAYLTPEGEWVGKGEMGWFGCGTETGDSSREFQNALEKYIAEHPDQYITIVDCHI